LPDWEESKRGTNRLKNYGTHKFYGRKNYSPSDTSGLIIDKNGQLL